MKTTLIALCVFITFNQVIGNQVKREFFANYPGLQAYARAFALTSIEREILYEKSMGDALFQVISNTLRHGGTVAIEGVENEDHVAQFVRGRVDREIEHLKSLVDGIDGDYDLVYVDFYDPETRREAYGYLVLRSGLIMRNHAENVFGDFEFDFDVFRKNRD